MHYNHSLPMANLVLDYLMAEASDRSHGAIDFPTEYAECYSYLQSSVYGTPGKFYDQTNMTPWMPKGLVKTDNVQVNHVTVRGENTLCIAFMNECDRELKDVAVQLDLPAGSHSATIWCDNQRLDTKLTVFDGAAKISLSPKGITALIIEGVKVSALFQTKFIGRPSPEKAITHQTIQTPFGEAKATILSFGPELTWLYAYLTSDAKTVKSAKVHVTLADQNKVLTDDSFPFEFSLPLKSTDTIAQLTFEAQPVSGQAVRSEMIRIGKGEPQ
jgi:hypothetical protein